MSFTEAQVKAVLTSVHPQIESFNGLVKNKTLLFLDGHLPTASYVQFLQTNFGQIYSGMTLCEISLTPKTPYYALLFALRYLSTETPHTLGKIMQSPMPVDSLAFKCGQVGLKPITVIIPRRYAQDIKNITAIISFYVLCYLEQTRSNMKIFKKNECYALTLLHHLATFETNIQHHTLHLSYLYKVLYRTYDRAQQKNSRRLLLKLDEAMLALEKYVTTMIDTSIQLNQVDLAINPIKPVETLIT